MTNADKIRSMTDEQLAVWLDYTDDQWEFCNNRCPYSNGCGGAQDCVDGRLAWLQQEHKE
jgi:hypothetical protein